MGVTYQESKKPHSVKELKEPVYMMRDDFNSLGNGESLARFIRHHGTPGYRKDHSCFCIRETFTGPVVYTKDVKKEKEVY